MFAHCGFQLIKQLWMLAQCTHVKWYFAFSCFTIRWFFSIAFGLGCISMVQLHWLRKWIWIFNWLTSPAHIRQSTIITSWQKNLYPDHKWVSLAFYTRKTMGYKKQSAEQRKKIYPTAACTRRKIGMCFFFLKNLKNWYFILRIGK